MSPLTPTPLERLRAAFGRAAPPAWLPGAGRALAVLAMPAMVLLVVSPLLLHPWTLGQHDWDQMNTQRAVVAKSLLRFHEFPLWDPYECGGHPAWSALESDPVAVSPWLPAYLLAPLPIAIRIEIVGSALLGALGYWVLGSRFTKSVALRALLVVAVAVDSRWSLQLAAGHTWHLLYGYLPWVLYLFDRAIDPEEPAPRARLDVVLAGACLAIMVYGDAIYPVPHAGVLLAIYAGVIARATRSWRPVRALAAVGAVGVGLAAPKLLPLLELLRRYPRHIASEEGIVPPELVKVLTWRLEDLRATTSFTNGMWHEWGLYLGWLGLGLLVAGVGASRGPRARGLVWAGLTMVVFVFGGGHQLLPWRLLHLLPVFSSQHVPSRWLYPAIAALACAAVSGGERWLGAAGDRRPMFEALLGVAAAVLALDLGLVARGPLAQSFVNPVPDLEDRAPPFHVVHRLPPRAGYEPCLWDIATLPGVLDNVGTLECDTFSGVHSSQRDEDGRMAGVGAWGRDDVEYRGEAYVAEGSGAAQLVSWTPRRVEVRVEGAREGDHLVLNQNWDPGWRADGQPAVAYRDAVAAVLAGSSGTVRFEYWPRPLGPGLALLGLTWASIALWLARGRRAES